MTQAADSVTHRFRAGSMEHCLLPPHDGTRYTSATRPFSFGVSFTSHHRAVVANGLDIAATRSFGPGTAGLNGPRTITWMQVAEPSESVDIRPVADMLSAVADLTGCQWDDLAAFRQVPHDDVIWGTCIAFRAAARRRTPLTEAAAEALIANVVLHVAVHHLGGRSRGFVGRLPPDVVGAVGRHLRRHRSRVVPLTEMAEVAFMSPYHLHRAFRRTVGLTPAEFAMAVRIEHAYRAVALGATERAAAADVGFTDMSYFRRSQRRVLGNAYSAGTAR